MPHRSCPVLGLLAFVVVKGSNLLNKNIVFWSGWVLSENAEKAGGSSIVILHFEDGMRNPHQGEEESCFFQFGMNMYCMTKCMCVRVF